MEALMQQKNTDFTKAYRKFFFNLHYNRDNGYLFLNGK